jgi:chorismate mutase
MPHVYEAKRQVRKEIEDKAQEAAVLEAALAATREAAAAAGTTAPDATQARLLFKALIEMGRQVQQRLADDESAKRLATVRERVESRRAARAAAEAAGRPAEAPGTDASEEDESDLFLAEPRGPRYDLATELRPAIARITGKIARILVAFDQPVSSGEAKRRFAAALADQNINSGQIDVLAETVENISERAAGR